MPTRLHHLRSAGWRRPQGCSPPRFALAGLLPEGSGLAGPLPCFRPALLQGGSGPLAGRPLLEDFELLAEPLLREGFEQREGFGLQEDFELQEGSEMLEDYHHTCSHLPLVVGIEPSDWPQPQLLIPLGLRRCRNYRLLLSSRTGS